MLATCIQHEIDHLEGILFIDYLSKLKKTMIIKKLSKQKKELERKESILLDRELEYKKCRDELDIARENFGEVAFEFKQNNQELDREISETKELKDNRERARNRILGIDKESNKLRGVIESQIQELSSKIDKLESI